MTRHDPDLAVRQHVKANQHEKPAGITDDLGTCQICERVIKLLQKGRNTGKLCHHGYRRPGYGQQTGSCFGATRVTWEVGCDALEDWIKILLSSLAGAQESLAHWQDPTLQEVTIYFDGWRGRPLAKPLVVKRGDTRPSTIPGMPDVDVFDQHVRELVRRQTERVRQLTREIQKARQRYELHPHKRQAACRGTVTP